MTTASIILPTYNEKENIPLIINKIENALRDFEFEIIVVDDNSPDRTWFIANQISQKKNYMRVIRRLHQKGLSSAAMEGFSFAKGEFLILMDADMQHDEKILPLFIDKFRNGSDIVIGSRKTKGGSIEKWSYLRRFMSWVATKLANLFLPETSSDPMSGFFGIRKNFYDECSPRINPRGFKILLEFLNQATNKKISEVGYTFKPRKFGYSKLSGSVMIDYLIGLYDLRFGKILSIRFIKYAVVGLSGVIINQLGLFLGKSFFYWTNDKSLIIGIELSIITNFILNNFWTFQDRKLSSALAIIKGLFFFHLISLAGAIINFSTAVFLHNKIPINIYMANFIGIALATLWNFFLNLNVTWGRKNYS